VEKLKELGEVKDPIDQVRQTFAVFGAEVGEKTLPFLSEKFGDDIKDAREWGGIDATVSLPSMSNLTSWDAGES
jgi:hypothetical protein